MERILILTILFAGLLTLSVSAAPVLLDTGYKFTKAGDTTSVDIILDGFSNGISGFKLQISPEKQGNIIITDVKFPDWIQLKNTTLLPSESVVIKGVDLNDKVTKADSKVVLATVEIKSVTGEKGSLHVVPLAVDDDNGNPVFPQENKIINSITGSITPFPQSGTDNSGNPAQVVQSVVPQQNEETMIESAISITKSYQAILEQVTQGNIINSTNTEKELIESSTKASPVFSRGVPVSTVPAKNDTSSQSTGVKKQPGFLIIGAVFSLFAGFIIFRKFNR